MARSLMMSELMLLLKDNPLILDVREDDEFASGHIAGAISLPISRFDLSRLDKQKTYYVVCASGARSYQVTMYLDARGYSVVNVLGGMGAYRGRLAY